MTDSGIYRKFALSYARSMNATQAAMDCGYPKNTASRQGARLLKHKTVLAELLKVNTKTQRESIADIAELREFWTRIMRGERDDIPAELLVDEAGEPLDPAHAALIRWKYRHDIGDRTKASELLGKSLGAFIEREIERERTQVIERIIERRIVHVAADAK